MIADRDVQKKAEIFPLPWAKEMKGFCLIFKLPAGSQDCNSHVATISEAYTIEN